MKEHRRNTGSTLSIITLPERIHCVGHHPLPLFDRTLLDLSFSLSFPRCPFAVELRAPDFAFPIINHVSLQSDINNPWLMMQQVLFKWIYRVCRFVGFLRNLVKMIVGYWCTKVCRAFQKFEIVLLWRILRVAKRKIFYWSTSKFIFSKTNRKILKPDTLW